MTTTQTNASWGWITDVETLDQIRPATEAEWYECRDTSRIDGGAGAFSVPDYPSTVFVAGGPLFDEVTR